MIEDIGISGIQFDYPEFKYTTQELFDILGNKLSEKALESSELVKDLDQDHSAKAVLDGVGLCHKMFLDTLGKENVAVVDPHGEPFDPNLHQAMSMVENPDMEPNSVVAVIQKGYQLNGRLVRPAMVMVSKGVSPSIDETV